MATASEWQALVAAARRKLDTSAGHPFAADDDDDDEYLDQHYDMAMQSLSSCLAATPLVVPLSREQGLVVRTVLRFLLITLSAPPPRRTVLQNKLCVPRFLGILGRLIARQQDNKSRVAGCRLLTNLVTGNASTSLIVLNHFEWQPPIDEQAKRVAARHSADEGSNANEGVSDQLYWLDLLLAATSSSREALAALVVCWYNALKALTNVEENTIHKSMERQIVQASLIIANLLRNILPSTAVLSSQTGTREHDSAPDEATEWITLLICHLSGTVPLECLYASATGQPHEESGYIAHHVVVPEHVVLLQLFLAHLEDTTTVDQANSLFFGASLQNQQHNIAFLAHNLYAHIRSLVYSPREKGVTCVTASAGLDETSRALGPTALCLIREVLAEVLVQDGASSKILRDMLGQSGTLGPMLLEDLAYHYDSVQARFHGRPAKDVVLTDPEKRIFVSLVRLLGNMSYTCRSSQDRLRTTLVPPRQSSDEQASTRTGLHLLLSCTSLSHTCFTLREWSVIAIRNALDGNTENQALVAELQAQQPAPSAPLEEMGIRMQLEKNGKVSLTPIQEHDK